ncbi:hypothetical protein [Agromyces kandeliae]|uniref:Uncharacterized protein n=1 Tax=Agromyces kandeliae TaxID=2666141 RepID=A0A6L5QWF5_9MICO|nr:hypothetical protein [Agromyces kandeliae]MRX42120.1 hypothetical protein [Agromyces kandeliae]
MIEYRWLRAIHGSFLDALEQAAFLEPELEARRRAAVDAVRDAPAVGLLGAFIHHVVARSDDGSGELDLLERASATWSRGRELAERLGSIRAALESALENPAAPNATGAFDTATVQLQELANEAIALRADVDAIRAEATTMQHLPPHPRQDDLEVSRWGWGDRVIARRGDAFVRAVYRNAAQSTPRCLAAAVGVTSAYAAHATGSAFLNHVVGGPRRLHHFRDRLGSYSIGSWVSSNLSTTADTPSRFADLLDTVAPNGELDPDLDALLTASLREAYDLPADVDAPSMRTGVERVIRHLRLLDSFTMPAVPAPPSGGWMQLAWSDPGNPPAHLVPQDLDVVGTDNGPAVQVGPGEPGPGTPGKSDVKSASEVCGVIALILLVADVVQAFIRCVVQWADGETCTFWENMFLSKLFEQDPPDPREQREVWDPQSTEQGLTAVGTSPQALQLVMLLFDLHTQTFDTLARARTFLVITGLIAPESTESLPLYEQFVRITVEPFGPHLEEPDPESTYHRYPTTEAEEPTATPSPYPHGALPRAVSDGSAALDAGTIALSLWSDIAHGADGDVNLDLDADRGHGHPAWEAAGSVHDAPVPVRILDYTDQ